MSSIQALISSKIRIEILRILTLNAESALHINELIRQTGFSPRGVERELKNLLSVGILRKEISGNQHHYQLDSACPIYPEIKGLVLKTVGLYDVLKRAFAPAKDHIELVFVFGSFATGDYGNKSDVDLFVVSDLPGVELAKLTGPVQNEIGRAVNVSHFSTEEFRRRKQEKDHFVTRALGDPRMTIIEKLNDT
jgi:predicted nucleotidyltransferase